MVVLTLLSIIYCFATIVYWTLFFADYKDSIYTKKQLIKSFIPFYWWVVNLREFYRDLE